MDLCQSSELVLQKHLREVAIRISVVDAAAPVPGVAEAERERLVIAELVQRGDLLAALDEVARRPRRDAADVLRPDEGGRQRQARQDLLVLEQADDAIAPGQ